MDFRFKIKSIGSGWIDMAASDGAKDFPIRISNKSDPFDELLEMLIRLDGLCASGDDFSDSPGDGLYLFWDGDNSQYTLKFTPLKNRIIRIEISLCENLAGGVHMKDVPGISGETALDELMKSVYQDMLEILRRHGFLGYRKEFKRSCFPVCYFLQLHKLVNGASPQQSGFVAELAALSSIGALCGK